jgi:hypothetical protein
LCSKDEKDEEDEDEELEDEEDKVWTSLAFLHFRAICLLITAGCFAFRRAAGVRNCQNHAN